MPRGKGGHMAGTTQESPKLARRAPRRAVRLSYPLSVAIRPRVAGPNAVSVHEDGRPRWAAHWGAVLSRRKAGLACLAVTHK